LLCSLYSALLRFPPCAKLYTPGYDTSHGFVHRDLLNIKHEKRKTPLFITDRNDALTFAENDIRDNWELYKERFVREGKI